MKYTICTEQKDLLSVMWNVFASFGYKDAVESDFGIDANNTFLRLAVDNGLSSKLLLFGCLTEKAMAEIAAVVIEASLAAEIPDFCLYVTCSEKVAELLYLYGLDEYCNISDGTFEIKGKSGQNVVLTGKADDSRIECNFDIQAIFDAIKNDTYSVKVPETVIFAEPKADGIAYEISYNMRLSGCLVTNYLENGTIEDCEKYALKQSAQSIIRVFADGKIQIKELSKGEITETDYNTFVGYYDDLHEDDECDCGHDHHCDCGHDHHDPDHKCSCGCNH